MDQEKIDIKFMSEALELAKSAGIEGEVPVGAVIVKDNTIIARASNSKEKTGQASRHAEINILEMACEVEKNWRLTDCTLYVTLEPCIMCAGALWQYRIGRVVFGAKDPKGGALTSLYQIGEDTRLNHNFPAKSQVLEQECSVILKNFFKEKRKPKKEG